MSQTLIASGDTSDKNAGLYSCKVALGGDLRQIVVKGADSPITLPELLLLQSIHGPDAVTEVIEEKRVRKSPADVLGELQTRYGETATQFFDKINLSTMPFVNPTIMTRQKQDQLDAAKAAILAGEDPFDVITNNPLMPDMSEVEDEDTDDVDETVEPVDPEEPEQPEEPERPVDPLAHL